MLLTAIFLGVVQGLTEFLPVSSSGHLVLATALLGVEEPGLSFAIWVHAGTALATLAFLREEIAWLLRGIVPGGAGGARRNSTESAWRVVGLLVLGSAPAALVGLVFSDAVERVFSSPAAASGGLLLTGLVLFLHGFGEKKSMLPSKAGSEPFASVNANRAFLVGLAQAFAVLPGVSRSGATITAGVAAGMSREDAARFSFALSLVAVSGAMLLDSMSALRHGLGIITPANLMGAAAAFVSGFLSLHLVFRTVRRGRFSSFAYYCWLVGAVGLVMSLR